MAPNTLDKERGCRRPNVLAQLTEVKLLPSVKCLRDVAGHSPQKAKSVFYPVRPGD